jgi:hypothetical protein
LLFKKWREHFREFREKKAITEDQQSFRVALFETPVRFAVLPPEIHYLPANFMRVVGPRIYAVHNHDFELAKQVADAFNHRTYGDYSGWVDGLGAFRNPYSMELGELSVFSWRVIKLLPFLWARALYIRIKSMVRGKN